MVDTGACCNTGYAKFWLPILKANPHIVEDVLTSDDGKYQPIILGGVVTGESGDMSKHTTALTLVAKLHLRYETIHHQPVSFSLAIGNNVGVNTIVGKTFIKALQCVYDSLGGVLETRLLNVAPFPITDMYPQHYSTEDKVTDALPDKSYASIVQKLTAYEKVLGTLQGTHDLQGTNITNPTAKDNHNALIEDKKMAATVPKENNNGLTPGYTPFHNGGFDTGFVSDSPNDYDYSRARKLRTKQARFFQPSPVSCLRDDYASDDE